MEAKLQRKVSVWLKKKGCYVMVIQPQAGIPTGCPDIIALVPGGGWLAIELKQNARSKYQPLQKETIKKLDEMYWCRVVTNDNWDDVRKEIETILL